MIQPIKIDTTSFLRKSILKKYFLEGKLPSVKFDIYGKPIDPKILNVDTITLEHNIPKSLGGKSKLANYSLANALDNNKRGSKNLLEFTTLENIKNWYEQFKGIKLPNFDGDQYIENGIKNLKKIDIKI